MTNTPLTPYIDKELLQHTPLHIDGSAIERETGFEYTHPNVSTQPNDVGSHIFTTLLFRSKRMKFATLCNR